MPKLLAPVLLGFTLVLARADPAPGSVQAPGVLAREIVAANAGASQKGLGDWLYARIDAYDFSINARKAWEGITEDRAFLDSDAFRQLEPEKQTREVIADTVLKFMEGDPKYSAGTIAWLRLFFSPASNWEQSYPLYQKVAEERPRDFIPKAFLLFRPVTTLAATSEWYSVF